MDPDILVPAFKQTVVDEDPIDQLTHGHIATRLRRWVRHAGDQRLPNPGIWVHRGATWATPEDVQNSRHDIALRLAVLTPSATRLHDMGYQPILELESGELIVSAFGTRLRRCWCPVPAMRVRAGRHRSPSAQAAPILPGGCWPTAWRIDCTAAQCSSSRSVPMARASDGATT